MGRRRKRSVPRTFVVIVQDKSGSMYSRLDATISGFNEYKNSLRRDAKGEVLVTLTQFDTYVGRVHSAVPIHDVPDLNHVSYVPGGATALYDAVGQAVRDAERAVRESDRVLVVIMTDGQENSSKEWRRETILSLMDQKREADWEFVFLGAGQEAWAAGAALGFDHGHSIYYGTGAHSHGQAFAAMATSTSDYTRGVNVASSLTANPIKASLETEATNLGITLTPSGISNTSNTGGDIIAPQDSSEDDSAQQ